MTVIKTSVKKRLFRAFMPCAAALAGLAGIMLYSPEAEGTSSNFIPKTEYECSVENLNDSETLLYKPSGNKESESSAAGSREHNVPKNASPGKESVNENIRPEKIFPEKYITTINLNSQKDDLSRFDVQSGRIYEITFGKGSGPEYVDLSGSGQIRNCTEISNNVVDHECSVGEIGKITRYSSDPQVLILHTHTSESYEPYTKEWYDERYTSRSPDPHNSVVAVGDSIADELARTGISVIHDCTLYDTIYKGAYERSLEAAVMMMKQYPSIKYVLDIHRDAIEYEDGSRISAVTEINGKKAAQVMIICAADDGTYDVPDFFENLHFASEFQQSMESMFPTLTRPVLFQYCQYNQQISPGALLIEVGSHGNSIDEAIYSGELIGKALSELLIRNSVIAENKGSVLSGVPLYFFNRII